MQTVMETKSVKLNLQVKVWPKASSSSSSSSSSKFLSSVDISINREIEEFLKDENDNSVTSLGTNSDPKFPSVSLTLLKFQSFEPNYVYQSLQNKLYDHVLSQHICNQIVDKAHEYRRRRRQSFDIPLSVAVCVKLIRKEYTVLPLYSSPTLKIDLKKQNEEEEEEEEPMTCSICLENVLVSESEKRPICQMPNCSHLFHEDCVVEWLNRLNKNSCPLCRQFVNEEQE